MTEPLPQRPFTELPAPHQGVDTAVREGRRIRRRHRAAGAGAGLLSLALVAGAVVATSGAGPSATDELIPAGPASASPSAGPPSPPVQPTATGHPGLAAAPVSPSPVAAPTLLPSRPSASPSPARVVAADPGGYRTPDLVRRYRPAPTPSGGPAGRICSGRSEYGGGGGLTNGTGYCLAGYTVGTTRGHDLVIEVCRDSTGPGRLRFPGELEADFLVHDPSRADRVVWQWAAGRSNDQDTHGLDVETSACWTWTAPWTDVNASGAALSPGGYELQVVSHAREVRAVEAARVPFTVD